MSAYSLWQKRESPLWLTKLSQAEIGDQGARHADLERLIKHIYKVNSELQPLNSSDFIQNFDSGHHEFLKLLQQEANAYHKVFEHPSDPRANAYSTELISQVKESYGSKSVEELEKYGVNAEAAGNLMVASAIAAIRDISLIEHLHKYGRITDEEKAFGLDEINNKMNRSGINGVDKLLETRPELEHALERNTSIIDVGHLPNHLKNDKMTRAAYYISEKSAVRPSAFELIKTYVRENAIAGGLPDIEKKKELYLAAHSKDIPPLPDEISKKFAILREAGCPIAFDNADILRPLAHFANRGHNAPRDEYAQFLLHEGIAINHPHTEKFVADMKLRKAGIYDGEINLAGLAEAQTELKLPHSSNQKLQVIPSSAKETATHSNSAEVVDAELVKPTGKTIENVVAREVANERNWGAKIATIGGATAVGLLMATGKNKETGKDGANETLSDNHRAVRFAAIASATAISVGGAIIWSKKPEFLYKPVKNLINSVSSGLSK